MGRSILAVVLGFIVANVVIMGVHLISTRIYPLPPGFDMHDPEAMRERMSTMPPMAFLWVALAHVLGTVAGAAFATWMTRRSPALHAVIVGGLVLAGGVANQLMLPHPAWFWPVDLATYPLGTYIGWLVGRRRASAA
jgi:hypothetical protein